MLYAEQKARHDAYAKEAPSLRFKHPDDLFTGNTQSSAHKRKGVNYKRGERYVQRGGIDIPAHKRWDNKYVQEGRLRQEEAAHQAQDWQERPHWQQAAASSQRDAGSASSGAWANYQGTARRDTAAHSRGKTPVPRDKRSRCSGGW